MNVTAEFLGNQIEYSGQVYVPSSYIILTLVLCFVLGLLGLVAVEVYINTKWRRQLIDLGHENAYLDVLKAKKKFVKTDSVQLHDD